MLGAGVLLYDYEINHLVSDDEIKSFVPFFIYHRYEIFRLKGIDDSRASD